jgi:hypothetical protein
VTSVADLGSADFLACVGETVTVSLDDRPVELTVDAVEVFGPGFDRPEAFSVLFTGPADAPLPQQMYGMGHERLGDAEVFLVPIGLDDRGFHYEAVFN